MQRHNVMSTPKAGAVAEPGEPGSSNYIGLGEPSQGPGFGGFAGYNPPSWGQENYGGGVGVGGVTGEGGQSVGTEPGAYTGYVDSQGRPTSDAYQAPRAEFGGGQDMRNIIGSEYSDPSQLSVSNNPLDYLNPFGGTTRGGSGTGVPTQKAVGTAVGTLSNILLPGSGFITGPLARWVTHLVQGGMSKQQAQQVAQQKVAQGKLPPMPSGSVSLPTQKRQGGGGFGNPFGGLPQGFTESSRFGMGAPTFTGPGAFGGQFSGGSAFHGITLNDILASGATPRSTGAVQAPGSGGFSFLGGGASANAQALGGGAMARHYMNVLGKTGYVAPTQRACWWTATGDAARHASWRLHGQHC